MPASILDIEGVGAAFAAKLKAAGVSTVEALLEKGATPKSREALAAQTGIDQGKILEWVNHADLFRIRGVSTQYSDLLEASGVDTVVELAQRNPANLHARLIEVNEEKHLVRLVPAISQVEAWIEHAKSLPRVVTY